MMGDYISNSFKFLLAGTLCAFAPAAGWAAPSGEDGRLTALSVLIAKEQLKFYKAPALAKGCKAGDAESLTECEMGLLRAKIAGCWDVSAVVGAPEPEKLLVVIDFELDRDGALVSPPRVINDEQIESSGDRFWRAAAQAALDAVTNCAPYDFFSPETYEMWKELRLNFDPGVMSRR